MNKDVLKEKERIKKLIEEKEEAVEGYCEKKYQKAYGRKGFAHRKRQSYNNLSKSYVLKLFNWLKFRIDNPNYIKKDKLH